MLIYVKIIKINLKKNFLQTDGRTDKTKTIVRNLTIHSKKIREYKYK